MANTISNYAVIDVTPTLDTNEYASGDALFNKQEIPNAVLGNKGCSKLLGITINSKKAADTNFIVYFMTNNQSVAAANAAINVSAADGASAGFLGFVEMAQVESDLGNFVIHQMGETDEDANMKMLLQAAEGSSSVYFFASTTTVQTYAANDLTFRFHIQYK